MREYVSSVLAMLPNVDVEAVASGEEGLHALEERWFDLILSDQRMGPKLDGVHFLERSRAIADGAPRVMMTAYGDTRLTEAAKNTGRVSRFVSKPFSPDELLAVVSELLGVRRAALRREEAFARAMALGPLPRSGLGE
jgi:DNA-binding NtrC family response regulator